jgi:hypothetical protein
MAKLVSACFRTPPANPAQVKRSLTRLLLALCPEALSPPPPVIATDDHGFFLGMLNPPGADCVRHTSAYAGWLMNPRDDWWVPGAETPEGTFALVRGARHTVEALEDYAGSRTLWIASTDECFIASTSQRAIPWLLGSFEADPRAAAWMLSAGLLGPEGGWDRRARPLGPCGRAVLDRQRWRLTVDAPDVALAVGDVPHAAHVARLRGALERTFAAVDLPGKGWPLTLSGGFDSRAILLLSRNTAGLRCLTWDSPGAVDVPGSEAYVARAVADRLGVPLQIVELEVSDEPTGELVDRFLAAGEGRIDRIGGYLDGLRLWQSLFDEGTPGILRGDHGLGWGTDPASPEDALRMMGLLRWRDQALPPLAALGLEHLDAQALPAWASPRDGETLGDFRDRLYHRFRIPCFTAALTEIKAPYLEIANPLLVKSIHSLQRGHPEPLRGGKTLFREVIEPLDIPVPYAHKSGGSGQARLFAAPGVGEFLRDQLNSADLRGTLSPGFADHVLEGMARDPGGQSAARLRRGPLRRRLKSLLPKSSRQALRKHARPSPPPAHLLALRAVIIARMVSTLEADARNGREDGMLQSANFSPLADSA